MIKKIFNLVISLLSVVLISSCSSKEPQNVDMILMNCTGYTVDSMHSVVNCIVIHQQKIVATGDWEGLKDEYTSQNIVDLNGGVLYPGLIDAHCHFYSYGMDQRQLDLRNVKSFDDMVQKVIEYGRTHPNGWIIGRGWNENNWEEKTTINNLKLSLLFPDRPVVLRRVDGHSALANLAALRVAGINEETVISGGEIENFNGRLTGILVDKAAERVLELKPKPSRQEQIEALKVAEQHCLRAGLTTVADAGLELSVIQLIDSLQKEGELKIRVYAMANPGETEFEFFEANGPIKSDRMRMQSFKLYADGALGSEGALLLSPYCTDTAQSYYGLLQQDITYYDSLCARLYRMKMQVNTHCIGDSANRVLLGIYGKYNGKDEDLRWRIEHAQVVDPKDWHLFGKYGVIPSVQPTHLISDIKMARKKLCSEDRLEGAYAYKSLLNNSGTIAFGTDFPVENISPIATYLAAVYREPANRDILHPEEKFTHQEALKAMTLSAAHACFWDDEIGSIEVGKSADITILGRDLRDIKPNMGSGSKTSVLGVLIDGEIVFKQ